MDSVVLRPARIDDVEQLTNLAMVSKQHWGYPETLIQLWRADLEFTPESIRAHTVTVAERAGRPVGVSAFSLSGETAELEHLWVHPSFIGQGLGAALFQRLVAQARSQGAASLIIDSDPHAEEFYRRLGALPAGSVPSKPAGRRLPRLVYSLSEKAAAMRVVAGVLLLCSYVLLLYAGSAAARPERVRPGMSYYSDEFVVAGLVRDLGDEKNYEEVYQLYSYYEAIYDAQERVVTFKEYKRGELIRTEEYRYESSGDLLERRTLRPGMPVEITPAAAPAGD